MSIFFFTGVILFITAVIIALTGKKIRTGKMQAFAFRVHFISLALTILFVLLWSFRIHVRGQFAEVLPFWIFILSGVFIFGCVALEGLKKIYFGFLFFAHLFFSAIIVVPFIGFGITFMLYSYFIPEEHDYETKDLRLQEDARFIMSPMMNPKVYIKCGWYELKRETDIQPVYHLDSVTLQKLDDRNVLLKFYDSDDDSTRIQPDTIACGCR